MGATFSVSRTPRFAGRATVGGAGCMVLFSLPFLGVGVVVMLIALRIIPVDPASVHAPPWVLLVFGGVFAGAGLLVSGAALKGLADRRRAAARAAAAREPWLADHDWDETGVDDSAQRSLATAWAMALFLPIFLSIFHWALLTQVRGIEIFPWIIIGIFDLAWLGVLGWALYLTGRRWKYGVSRLRFTRPPFRPGGKLDAVLIAAAGVETFTGFTAELLCCEEERVTRTHGGKTESRVEVRVLHSSTHDLPCERLQPGEDLPLALPIPIDAPGTCINGDKPRYWLLAVAAATPGIDFKAEFLVPVYAEAP